jgi:cell division protein FtsB
MRRRARQVAPQVVAACLVGYFAYHLVHGERGLSAYLRLKQDLAAAEQTRAEVTAERKALEQRVALLRAEHLDPDMLSERARNLLGYGRANEIVVLPRDEEDGTAAR